MSKSIATPTAAAASAPRDPAAPNSDQTTTVEKFTEGNIEAILRSEEHRRASAPSSYRKIQTLTAYCGTIPFLIANAALTLLWMAVNQWLWRFDPYPYTFLVFGLSIEAIFLSILILISQNMATAESERRHHLDLQINLLNERETTALLRLTTLMASALGVSHAGGRPRLSLSTPAIYAWLKRERLFDPACLLWRGRSGMRDDNICPWQLRA